MTVVTLALLVAVPAVVADIVSIPRISDGDTVEIAGTKIRLNGIDAPETDQFCLDAHAKPWPCGVAARDALTAHAGGKAWPCAPRELDRYGRTVASCTAAGEDVNRWMVRHGWALAFVRYDEQYSPDEDAARKARAGLWAGAFIAPWDWRARNASSAVLGAVSVPVGAQRILLGPDPTAGAPSSSCTIKGNTRREGTCVYHEPGGRWFAKVNMDGPGKCWFCSTAEAEAAGCRAARE